MTVAPILDSITLVRFVLMAAIDPLTTRGVYWQEASSTAVRPFVVIQSQDAGGISTLRLDSQGWSGLITVKALADSIGMPNGNALAAAEALLATVALGMAALVAPAGYDLSVQFVRPLVLPPSDGVWQIGHIWEVQLERAVGTVTPPSTGWAMDFSQASNSGYLGAI